MMQLELRWVAANAANAVLLALVIGGCAAPEFGFADTVPGGGDGGNPPLAGAGSADEAGRPASGGEATAGGQSSSGGDSSSGSSGAAGAGAAAGAEAGAAGEAPVWHPAGMGLQFDGAQLVTFAAAPLDDITIEMWVQTSTQGGTPNWYDGAALFRADTAGVHNDFGASIVGDSFAFGTGNPDVTPFSQTPIDTGRWFHVACSRERSSGLVRVLVNGRAEATLLSSNKGPLDGAPPPSMGGNLDGNGLHNVFVGIIDEVRLWNVVRTTQQISDNMQAALRGDEPGLVGYWRFDDGQGLDAADSSPSGNAARLGGPNPALAPTWVAYPEER